MPSRLFCTDMTGEHSAPYRIKQFIVDFFGSVGYTILGSIVCGIGKRRIFAHSLIQSQRCFFCFFRKIIRVYIVIVGASRTPHPTIEGNLNTYKITNNSVLHL